jgi:hypothetical protein
LNHILNVLSDVVSWKDLMIINTIKSSNTYHFKTISKIHLEWARNGIYERAYNQTLKDENIKITDIIVVCIIQYNILYQNISLSEIKTHLSLL